METEHWKNRFTRFHVSAQGVFRIVNDGKLNTDDLELELIDHGLENLESDEEEIIIYTAYEDFGKMAKALEEKKN